MVRVRPDDDERECPICMDSVKFGAETNCGHLYCSDCILRVWDENINTLTCIRCPYCRQDVTMLLSCFTESESSGSAARTVLENREMLKQRLNHYNRLHSRETYSYYAHFRELPTVLRHVWSEMFSWNGLQLLYRLRIGIWILFGIIYALVPFDLIPESLLGFVGLFDDILVLAFMLVQISVLFRSHVSAQ